MANAAHHFLGDAIGDAGPDVDHLVSPFIRAQLLETKVHRMSRHCDRVADHSSRLGTAAALVQRAMYADVRAGFAF